MKAKEKNNKEVIEGDLVTEIPVEKMTDYFFVIAVVGLVTAFIFNALIGMACALVALFLNIRNRKRKLYLKNINTTLIIVIATIVLSIATVIYNIFNNNTVTESNYECYNNKDEIVTIMKINKDGKFEWIDYKNQDTNFVKGNYSTSSKDVKYNGDYTLTFEGKEIMSDGEIVSEEYKVNYSVIQNDLQSTIVLIDNETAMAYYCKVKK